MSDSKLILEALVICSATFAFWVVLGRAGAALLSQLAQGIVSVQPATPDP